MLRSVACQQHCYCLSHVSTNSAPQESSQRDPIKGIFYKSHGVCVSKLYSVAQPLLTISASALHISRPLNPLMSHFFLIHTGWGQGSRTNGTLGISLYSWGALIIFNTVKGYFVTCCVVLAKSVTNLICTGKLGRIQLRLADDTSNWNVWNATGATAKYHCQRGPGVLSYNLYRLFFQTNLYPLK